MVSGPGAFFGVCVGACDLFFDGGGGGDHFFFSPRLHHPFCLARFRRFRRVRGRAVVIVAFMLVLGNAKARRVYLGARADLFALIHAADLDRDSPYNTYLKPGLPPGPIANPGLKSLEAALEPADTGDLFFVARPDGSGGHIFSRDSKSHAKAVVEYRNGVKAASNPRVARKPRAR